MKFKKVLLPFIAGALAISLAACGGDDKGAKEETSKEQVDEKKVVAVVNGEKLKGEQYNAALTSIQSQMEQMGQDPSSKEVAEQIKEQALDILVNQTLLLQQAKDEKIEASEAEIDEEYEAFAKQFGDEKAMKEMLKSQKVDVKTVKEQLAESIVFKKYQDQVAPVEKVSDEEIKTYYDQVAAQAKDSGQDLPPLQEASEEIKGIIEQQGQQEKLTAHVEKLKKDAKIELKI